MIKFRLYYDKDQETAFLNDMSRKGYAVTGFCMGFYSFDRCRPGEYVYQIDFTEGMFRVSNDYREFMRDMGVEIVVLWGPWVMLRKRVEDGPFVLYTDVESSIEHYTKIKKTFTFCVAVEVGCLFAELFAIIKGAAIGWAFLFMVAAVLVALIRQIVRINNILAELKARSGGECQDERAAERKPSGFLTAGLLLNSVGLMVPKTGWASGFLKGVCLGLAIVFMIAGIILTLWKKR